MKITMEPIGYIRSEFTEKKQLPKQSVLNTDKKARIEILPEYLDGIAGIEEGSHGVILFHFHKSTERHLK